MKENNFDSMEKQYRVSVVIPAYNREKTIRRCINSIINQTYPVYEIIVVDDGSRDKMLQIIDKEYASVKVIRQNHQGAQAARNAGIRAAEGEYIAFLDSDDEWVPDKLEIQIQALLKNRDAVICCDGFIQTDWEKQIPKIYKGKEKGFKKGKRKIYKMNGKSGHVYKAILSDSFCMFQAMLTSKQNLLEIGLLDERVPSFQEWDTAIRLAKKYEFIYIHKPLFVYHLHDDETISKNTEKYIDGMEYITEKFKYEILRQTGIKGLQRRYKELLKNCMRYKDKRVIKYCVKYIMAGVHLFFA